MIVEDILELIGRTPLIHLKSFSNRHVHVYAKLEYYNPSGSIKDRIVSMMIRAALYRGELSGSKVIVEPTSGNTGIALALIASHLGYRAKIIIPRNISREKLELLKILGADVVEVESEAVAYECAKEIVAKNPEKFLMRNQFKNDMNILAHYVGTAREIWEDLRGGY